MTEDRRTETDDISNFEIRISDLWNPFLALGVVDGDFGRRTSDLGLWTLNSEL
jgi:hypothetical protein